MKSFIVDVLKTRLDRFLAENLSGVSRSQIQRDIENGNVKVNGKEVLESKFVVRMNDKISYKQSEIRNTKSQIEVLHTPLKILYHKDGLLIIDKPAGLTVHPGAGFKGETLASMLLYQFKDIHLVGEEGRSGIVHRLDKDTSGVMLIATTQEMYEYLKDAFAQRKIKKEYVALAVGAFEKSHGFIDTPIGRSKTDFRKYSTKNMVEAKESLTEYKVLETLDGGKASVDKYTLILVKLHTGRTHQIRVHTASIGHPLVGDSLYGSKKSKVSGLSRQFLHAKRIEVQLPSGTWIEAESEFPQDLKEFLSHLGSKKVSQL